MNDENLNQNERQVLDVFRDMGNETWLSRPFLEHELVENKIVGQRALDRILDRLKKWEIIESIPTQDRGALFKLIDDSKDNEEPYIEFARRAPVRGKIATITPARNKCPHCGAEYAIGVMAIFSDPTQEPQEILYCDVVIGKDGKKFPVE